MFPAVLLRVYKLSHWLLYKLDNLDKSQYVLPNSSRNSANRVFFVSLVNKISF